MLFADLVAASGRVAATRSRIAKLRELSACLRALDAGEIESGVLWLAGETRQGKVGVGYSVLQQSSSPQAAVATLTLRDVDEALTSLQATRGAGSAARRKAILDDVLARSTADEQGFLLRLLVGELRQGALAGLMVDAIAEAAQLPPREVRRAAMYSQNVGRLARAALLEGSEGLKHFGIEVLKPIAPMLAQSATDVADALEQLQGGEIAFEWKVDGARVQVHRSGDDVRVYTRNLNDVTAAVPEVVEAVRGLRARELVLDGETVALDASARPRPFQVTMKRFGRRLDVDTLRRELPLHVYFFDCLLLDGESLAERPARERFAAIDRVLPGSNRIPRIVTASAGDAQSFYDEALAQGHEGVMAKALDSPYEAGSRGASWLKIKHVHTLDLVVLAAEWGSGRRKGWLSNLHLGARDPSTGGFVMLGKTFKGLTDAMLEWQTKEFLARETHRDSYTVHVRPEMVVEIAFNDIQASSQYEGGYALRFARVKAYRPDKTPDQSDTIEEIRRIYAAQGATG